MVEGMFLGCVPFGFGNVAFCPERATGVLGEALSSIRPGSLSVDPAPVPPLDISNWTTLVAPAPAFAAPAVVSPVDSTKPGTPTAAPGPVQVNAPLTNSPEAPPAVSTIPPI